MTPELLALVEELEAKAKAAVVREWHERLVDVLRAEAANVLKLCAALRKADSDAEWYLSELKECKGECE